MKDFSAKHRGVTYFGHWADDVADTYGKRDAWDVIKNCSARTMDEDVGTPEVLEAIEWLRLRADRQAPYNDFLKSLKIHDPGERYRAMADALNRIWRALNS